MIIAIAACEIGFWAILGAGLAGRYVLGHRRLGLVLLACVPLVDLALLVFTVVDLMSGGRANAAHGLAAVYLGVSIAFGRDMIRWADRKFAGRFGRSEQATGQSADGAPTRRYGAEHTKHEWADFGKAILAGAIASGLIGVGILLIGDPSRTDALLTWFPRIGIVLAVWAIWPISYTVSPKKAPAPSSDAETLRR